MSILDTFFILFESDTSKIDKGIKDSQDKAKGLNASLKDTDFATKHLQDSFIDLATNIGAALTAGFAFASMLNTAEEALRFTNQIGKFAEAMGMDVKEVAAWGEAVKISGGSAEGFNATLHGLSDSIQDLKLTGQSAIMPFLARIGISMIDAKGKTKDAIEILKELSGVFPNLNRAESVAIGQKLGLDMGTIMLLQKGSVEVEKLVNHMKAIDGVSKGSTKSAAALQRQIDELSMRWRAGFISIEQHVVPAIIKAMNALNQFSNWISTHKTMVEGFFIGVGIAAIPVLWGIATATWAVIAPFVAFAAAATALGVAFAFAFDDVMKFLHGQESFIGKMSKDFPRIGKLVKDVAKDIQWVFTMLSKIWDWLVTLFTKPADALKQLETSLSNIWQKVVDFAGWAGIDIAQTHVTNAGAIAQTVPVGQTQTNHVNVNANITVHESKDAKATGEAVYSTLVHKGYNAILGAFDNGHSK